MSYFYIHANGTELNVMDILQGYSQQVDGNPKLRMYVNGLEQQLKDPKFMKAVLDYGRRHYAKGGRVGVEPLSDKELEACRQYGRYGDDCVAVVGPYMKSVLDIFSRGKGTANPVTGFPEYFSLGGLFNSIGSGLSSIGNNVWNGVKNVGGNLLHVGAQALPGLAGAAGTAIGARFGGPTGAQIGGALGQQLGGMAAPIVNQFGQQLNPQSQQNPYQGPNPFTQMHQNYQQGMSPMQAGMQAFNPYMQSQVNEGGAFNHPLVNQAMQAYQNYMGRMQGGGGMEGQPQEQQSMYPQQMQQPSMYPQQMQQQQPMMGYNGAAMSPYPM